MSDESIRGAQRAALATGSQEDRERAEAEAKRAGLLVEAERAKLAGRAWLPPVHTSPETAYVIEDYPYGRQLRCRKRVWIETKDKHGQRVVYQTTDPKRPGERWNKPKAGTYRPVAVLYLDPATGYLESDGVGRYCDEARLAAFELEAAAALGEREQATLRLLRAVARAGSRVTYTVTSTTYEPSEGILLSQMRNPSPELRARMDAMVAAQARRKQERKEQAARERKLMRALVGNELAEAEGRALPVPELGTAAAPPAGGAS